MNEKNIIISLKNFDLEESKLIDLGNSKIIPIKEKNIPDEIRRNFNAKYILKIGVIEGEKPRRTLD